MFVYVLFSSHQRQNVHRTYVIFNSILIRKDIKNGGRENHLIWYYEKYTWENLLNHLSFESQGIQLYKYLVYATGIMGYLQVPRTVPS